ncbi:21032_t:CDS:1, partial [Dentiscutata erythropus]
LPEGSTSGPIHIINNCLEDAREYKKLIWILTHDISKAFDSINHSLLQLALKRINMSDNLIILIMNLYTQNTTNVITFYGKTDKFVQSIGIPQGDALSPLLW